MKTTHGAHETPEIDEARHVVEGVANTARRMMVRLGEDPEFSNLHRMASEQLVAAVQGEDEDEENIKRICTRLSLAEDYGRQALLAAKNARQRMLSMGLIMTVSGIRVLYETGLDTRVVP